MAKSNFFDEFKIELHSHAREYVKKLVRKRNNARCTTKMVKVGSQHIIVWGCNKSDI